MLFVFACVSDTKNEEISSKIDTAEMISSYWNCEKAERNGRPAASLDGLFFDFATKDTLRSNMMGEVGAYPYAIMGDTILQGGDLPVKYAIVELDSSEMRLNMEMNSTKFSFFLKKGMPDN